MSDAETTALARALAVADQMLPGPRSWHGLAPFVVQRLAAEGYAIVPADSLDAAWAEAEAALPEGWRMGMDAGFRGTGDCRAEAWNGYHVLTADAATPVAALRALAARLRERQLRDRIIAVAGVESHSIDGMRKVDGSAP